MHNKTYLKGMLAIALVLSLGVAACEQPNQTVTFLPTSNEVTAPAVTAKAITGGVRLTWAPVEGENKVSGYEIRRVTGNQYEEKTYDIDLVPTNSLGKYEINDTIYNAIFTDGIKPRTAYAYTVTALTDATNTLVKNSVWKGSVTTGAFPLSTYDTPAAPSDLTLVLDQDADTLKVSVRAPSSGYAPNFYRIIVRDSTQSQVGSVSISSTSTEYTFTGMYDSDYTVSASGSYNETAYSVAKVKKLDTPFSGYFFLNGGTTVHVDGKNIEYYHAELDISHLNGQAGITGYTIERAALDANGVAGEYTPVTLYNNSNINATGAKPINLIPDVFGDLDPLATTVYDCSLPAEKGRYKYRLSAVDKTVYLYDRYNRTVTVNPADMISVNLNVGAKTNAGYEITPSVTYNGTLASGDTVKLYYSIYTTEDNNGTAFGDYKESSVVFNAADIEAGNRQTLSVPAKAGTQKLSVQAKVFLADGTVLTSGYVQFQGTGVTSTGNTAVLTDY